jgi:hypothetical protein
MRIRKMPKLQERETRRSWLRSTPRLQEFSKSLDNHSCLQRGPSHFNINAHLSMTRSGFVLLSPTTRHHLRLTAGQLRRITTLMANGRKSHRLTPDSHGHRTAPRSTRLTDLSLHPIHTHHPTSKAILSQSGIIMDHPVLARCAQNITNTTSPIPTHMASSRLLVRV